MRRIRRCSATIEPLPVRLRPKGPHMSRHTIWPRLPRKSENTSPGSRCVFRSGRSRFDAGGAGSRFRNSTENLRIRPPERAKPCKRSPDLWWGIGNSTSRCTKNTEAGLFFSKPEFSLTDAYRDWLRAEEAAGNFKINDLRWDQGFLGVLRPQVPHFRNRARSLCTSTVETGRQVDGSRKVERRRITCAAATQKGIGHDDERSNPICSEWMLVCAHSAANRPNRPPRCWGVFCD